VAWVAFFVLLLGPPVLSEIVALAVIDSFYRVGSLVFGGGHVVLVLLWWRSGRSPVARRAAHGAGGVLLAPVG
jgi:hypothetical protein